MHELAEWKFQDKILQQQDLRQHQTRCRTTEKKENPDINMTIYWLRGGYLTWTIQNNNKIWERWYFSQWHRWLRRKNPSSVQYRNWSKWVICPTWHFKLGHFQNGVGQTMILKLWTTLTDIFMLFIFNCHSLSCEKWTCTVTFVVVS